MNRNSWCDPFKTWQKVTSSVVFLSVFRNVTQYGQAYTFNPLANLSTAQGALVLGGRLANDTRIPSFTWGAQQVNNYYGQNKPRPRIWIQSPGLALPAPPRFVFHLFQTLLAERFMQLLHQVFWTGATLPGGTPRNVESALPRLHDLRFRMVQRGIKAIALQPQWCALRPGVCDA